MITFVKNKIHRAVPFSGQFHIPLRTLIPPICPITVAVQAKANGLRFERFLETSLGTMHHASTSHCNEQALRDPQRSSPFISRKKP